MPRSFIGGSPQQTVQTDVFEIRNIGLVATVAANALTVALRDGTGSASPSAGSPVKVVFRGFTANDGTYVERSITSALSVTVPSGTTLGTNSNVPEYIHVYLIDAGGTISIALSLSSHWDEAEVYTTSAISGGADANTLYTTAAIGIARGIRYIGRLKVTEVTAGTWATAPSEIYCGGLAKIEKTQARAINFIPKHGMTFIVDCSAARTVSLPTPKAGMWFTLKDGTNQSGTNAITLARNASEKIENAAANYTLSFNGGAWKVWSDGTDWFVVATAQPSAKSPTVTTRDGNPSGAYTYNTPTGAKWLRVTIVGAGGGGAGSGTAVGTNGVAGGATTFSDGTNTNTAGGGGGGVWNGTGGAGGTNTQTFGTLVADIPGGDGEGNEFTPTGGSGLIGGPGGGTPYGKGPAKNGYNQAGSTFRGLAAATGCGGQGGGAQPTGAGNCHRGPGGGGGGTLIFIVTNPLTSYSVNFGGAGGKGTAGANGFNGGDGDFSKLVVEEFYE